MRLRARSRRRYIGLAGARGKAALHLGTKSDSDVVIVGAGVFGVWIALLARRAGFRTTLIDRYVPANNLGSAAGESRVLRDADGINVGHSLLVHPSLRT